MSIIGKSKEIDTRESICNAGDMSSIHGLGRSPGEGKAYPLQCSGLENSMDCTVYGVAKSRTELSNFLSHICFVTMNTLFPILNLNNFIYTQN